jgi:hypothetical protein
VAPSDPDTVFAAGAAYTTTTKPSDHSVILRSLNGGLSWTEVLSTAPGWEYKLAINPVDDAVVYAALNDDDAVHSGGRLRRSIDGGDTWQVILETQDDIGSIAIDPFDPGVIFAADAGRLRKSTDGGDTWSIACDPGTNPCGSLVVMDPNKPGHLYLGGHGYIGESDDGGVTWTGRDAPLNLGTPNSHPADLVTNHGTPIQTLYASFTGVWSHTRLSPTEGDRYVAPSGSDGDNRCTEANAPCRTVDRALEVANPGETIRVAAGTYSGMVSRQSPPGYNGPALISQHIYVDESVTIRGGYTADFGEPPDPAANPTTLDGGGQGRVVIIAGDASPTLEGLRIVNGDATGLGGSDEGWDAGGGIYILEAKAVLYNCSVGGSSAYAGGGLFFADSEATLARTIVRGNSADWGGGGLYLEGGAPVLVNNVIADNQAGDVGSGLHLDASSPLLLHNTVANNNGGEGSGVYVTDSSGSYSHAELVNTIIAGHSIGLHVTSGSTAVMDSTLWHGNTSNWTGSGSISPVKNYSGDPLFVDPGLGDYHIACGSAATNMGVNADVDEDIDGLPRPIGSGYDIGADETRCLVYLPLVLREVP